MESVLLPAIPRMMSEWPPDLVEAVVREQSVPLLLRRMMALGIDTSAVDEAGPILFTDLHSACVDCTCEEVCDRDLTFDPDGPTWMDYCPNAMSLRVLSRIEKLRMRGLNQIRRLPA